MVYWNEFILAHKGHFWVQWLYFGSLTLVWLEYLFHRYQQKLKLGCFFFFFFFFQRAGSPAHQTLGWVSSYSVYLVTAVSFMLHLGIVLEYDSDIWQICYAVLSHFSHVWLYTTLWKCSLPGSSVHGILQARILEWVAVLSFRGPSRPMDCTCVAYVSCDGRWVLYH